MKYKYLPSIMCSTPQNMADYIREFEKKQVDAIHFDVMDGHYVPNIMLGVRDYEAIKECTDLPVDLHLMCREPERFLQYFKLRPGDSVSFHPETTDAPYRLLQLIKELGCSAGLALSPGTPVSYIPEMGGMLDFLLVMAVNPGFAGQKMVPDHLNKLRRIRALCDEFASKVSITVDGNTSAENSRQMAAEGADGFVLGSSNVFKGSPELVGGLLDSYRRQLGDF